MSVEEPASHHRVVTQQQPQATGDRAGIRLDFSGGPEVINMEVSRTAKSVASRAAETGVDPWDDDHAALSCLVGRAGDARDDSPAGSSPVELTPLERGTGKCESEVGGDGSRKGGDGAGADAASSLIALTLLGSEREITVGADKSPPRQERMECDAFEEQFEGKDRQVSKAYDSSSTRDVAKQEEGASSPKQERHSSCVFPSHRFNLMELREDDRDDDDDDDDGDDGNTTGGRSMSSREQGGAPSAAPVVDTPSRMSPRRRPSTPAHERALQVSASGRMQPPKDEGDAMDQSGVSSTPDDVVKGTGVDYRVGKDESAHEAGQPLAPSKEVADDDVNSLSDGGHSVADVEGRDREMVDVLSRNSGHPVGNVGQESGLEDDGEKAASLCDEGDDVCIPETPSPVKKGDSKDSQAHTRQRPPFGGAIRSIGGSTPLSGGKQLGL